MFFPHCVRAINEGWILTCFYVQVKSTFLTAIGLFELGSLICGAAPTSTALIIGRAIAGLGVGGIFSGALVILAYSCEFPPVFRPSVVSSFLAVIQNTVTLMCIQ